MVAVIGGAGAPAQSCSGTSRSRQRQPQQPANPTAVQPAPATTGPQHDVSFPAGDRGQDGERLRSSPLVRRMARENNVDLSQVPGTGLADGSARTIF